MAKKFERVFRDRPLTPEEIARDAEVRRKVQVEFPPLASSNSESGRLTQALREAIRGSQKSTDQIAQDAGVAPVVVSEFLSGTRDVRLAVAERLAEAVGLKLSAT